MKISEKGKKLVKDFKGLVECTQYDSERVGGEEAEETHALMEKSQEKLENYIATLEHAKN